ncbi:helix-turn-helix domain-containing protein [Microbacterium galbinum]|uniref:Helix-turn-helix domain-containing protein n=1 Tax=Microbacterium galbinum TaxID=2851646 RepID=A0ABY4IJW3_9MICO|nr:helix-turn-helix domain-containing protein [Microbacterium galbinum]UPL13050.1 helix-turn-helix domain-containing protein [Microbacterium galbinum]
MSTIAFPVATADAPLEAPEGFEQMPMIMSPKALAEILEVSTKTLERWRDARSRGDEVGPVWHKLPGSSLIRYSRADVIEWFAACRESEAAS